jgi:uncharacterized protein (TIGR02588 family)
VERAVLLVSFLVIGGLLAIALNEEARQEEHEAASLDMTFAMDQVERRNGAYFIPYTIRNNGNEAIASARIWFDVFAGGQPVESAEITVQSLPLNGIQTGVYVTDLDPATHTVEGRLESIQFP